MKILIIGNTAQSLFNFRLNLVKDLLKQGHRLALCSSDADEKISKYFEKLGVKHFLIRGNLRGLNPFIDCGYAFKILQIIRREKINAIFAYSHKPIIFGGLAGRLLGIKKMYALVEGLGYAFTKGETGIDWRRGTARTALKTLYKLVTPWYNALFFVNDDDWKVFKLNTLIRGNVNTHVIYSMGIDLEAFRESPFSSTPQGPSFLMVSRIMKDKGVCEYAEAARIIKKKHPNTKFQLLGPFETHSNALKKDLINSWEKEGIVEYLDKKNNRYGVRKAMEQSHVVVLPSYYREGCPNVILEAMAIGRPVITSNMPGCRMLVSNDQNGFLVPPKNPEKLAEAMEKFIQDKSLIQKMGSKSRQLVEEKFDVKMINHCLLTKMDLLR